MATVKIINDIFADSVETISVNEGVTIESLFRENIDENVYSGTLVECYDLETGKTYFAPVEDNEDIINAIVQVNGKDVDLSYEVKENDVVSIIITPASGGGGSGWSWIGAVSGAIEGVLIGGYFSGWNPVAAIVGGVIGFIAGGLIIGSLEASMKLDNGSASKGIDSERLPDVRGATNQSLLNNPFPVVLGKHLVAPFIAGAPYNDISGEHGETNYIQALYCVGYAPLRITDIRLGDQYLAHNQAWSGNPNMDTVWSGKLSGTDSSSAAGSDTGLEIL